MTSMSEFGCRSCGAFIITRPGVDEQCDKCGTWHNSSGQILREPAYWCEGCEYDMEVAYDV